MSGLVRDLAFALRLFRQQKGFTAIALLTLALGIGATTAIFSVVNAVLLRPLPFEQSDRLVLIFREQPAAGMADVCGGCWGNFADWARESRTFESMTAFFDRLVGAPLRWRAPNRCEVMTATAEVFTVCCAAGRCLDARSLAGDDVPGGRRRWR